MTKIKVIGVKYVIYLDGTEFPIEWNVGESSKNSVFNYASSTRKISHFNNTISSHINMCLSLTQKTNLDSPLFSVVIPCALKFCGDFGQAAFNKDFVTETTDKFFIADLAIYKSSCIVTTTDIPRYSDNPSKFKESLVIAQKYAPQHKVMSFIGEKCNPNIDEGPNLKNFIQSRAYFGDPFKTKRKFGKSIDEEVYGKSKDAIKGLFNHFSTEENQINTNIIIDPDQSKMLTTINITLQTTPIDSDTTTIAQKMYLNKLLTVCDFLFVDFKKQQAVIIKSIDLLKQLLDNVIEVASNKDFLTYLYDFETKYQQKMAMDGENEAVKKGDTKPLNRMKPLKTKSKNVPSIIERIESLQSTLEKLLADANSILKDIPEEVVEGLYSFKIISVETGEPLKLEGILTNLIITPLKDKIEKLYRFIDERKTSFKKLVEEKKQTSGRRGCFSRKSKNQFVIHSSKLLEHLHLPFDSEVAFDFHDEGGGGGGAAAGAADTHNPLSGIVTQTLEVGSGFPTVRHEYSV